MPAAYSHLQFVPLAMNSIKFFFFFSDQRNTGQRIKAVMLHEICVYGQKNMWSRPTDATTAQHSS